MYVCVMFLLLVTDDLLSGSFQLCMFIRCFIACTLMTCFKFCKDFCAYSIPTLLYVYMCVSLFIISYKLQLSHYFVIFITENVKSL